MVTTILCFLLSIQVYKKINKKKCICINILSKDENINFCFFPLIGTAAVAKAMSNYLDTLLGDPQKKFMKKHFSIHMDFLGEYPDVASFMFIMTIARKLNKKKKIIKIFMIKSSIL